MKGNVFELANIMLIFPISNYTIPFPFVFQEIRIKLKEIPSPEAQQQEKDLIYQIIT